MLSIRNVLLGATAIAALGVCSAAAPAPQNGASANPFAAPSTLPLQAPAFDKIKDTDYEPAFDEGMKQQLGEIDKIASDPAAPNFDNTIVALEKSGQMLTRVSTTFFNIVSANTSPALDKIQAAVAPKLAAHQDAIFLNPKLFQRVKAVYDSRAKLHLDPESQRLPQVDYLQFVHAGANLSDADKAKLRALNKEEATLTTDFQQKLLAATKAGALVIDNKARSCGFKRPGNCRRGRRRQGAEDARQMGHPAAEHDAAALARVA